MAFSRITIDFVVIPDVDDVLLFQETTSGINFNEIFKNLRLAANQSKIPKFLVASGGLPDRRAGFVSTNYKDAINMDSNVSNVFNVGWNEGAQYSGLGSVTIVATFANAVFEMDLNTCGAVITIENETPTPNFTIDSVDILQSSTPCSNVSIKVQTSEVALIILEPAPIATNTNTDNPIIFDWLRGQTFTLKIADAVGTTLTQTITTPPLLSAANITVNVSNSPFGATMSANSVNMDGLSLEYSLDGATWQVSNVFPSLGVDEYTLYIRDNFGCSVTKDFSVNATGVYIPFRYVSKANPIRFAERVAWAVGGPYKNDENTLSCEVDVKVAHRALMPFISTDVIKIQFKSNYANNVVKIIKPDLSEDTITVNKMSANIGIKQKIDAIAFDYGNGKTGVYFTTGNILDYNTNAIIEPYALNGHLPYFGKVGNYISIGATWYQIEDVVFDDVRNVEALIVNGIFSGVDTAVVVGSVFNFQEYEVYEFSIDMSAYLGMIIQSKIIMTDVNFGTFEYLSEKMIVTADSKDTVEIRYWNDSNTDVFYSTGIQFKSRERLTKQSGISDQTSANHKTDTSVILLNADIYEADEFLFEPVTKEIMRKIIIALSHENVYINDVGYVKNDSVDVDGPLEDSNLYSISAKMIKNGNTYGSNKNSGPIYSGENLNVPGLVDFGGGFVEY